jgi:AcrR family transcriptional regulator
MKKQFTRNRIIKSAEKLFAAFDFADVSMRSISNMAEVNISSIYYYYQSKEELLEHIMKNAEQFMMLHLQCSHEMDSPIDQFLGYTSDFLTKLLGDSNLILIFLKTRIGNADARVRSYIDRIETEVSGILEALLNHCRRVGAFTLNIPNQVIINVFFIMMTEAGLYKRRLLISRLDTVPCPECEEFQVTQLNLLRHPIEALFRYILV